MCFQRERETKEKRKRAKRGERDNNNRDKRESVCVCMYMSICIYVCVCNICVCFRRLKSFLEQEFPHFRNILSLDLNLLVGFMCSHVKQLRLAHLLQVLPKVLLKGKDVPFYVV